MFDAIGNFIRWLLSAPFICLGWIVVGFLAGAIARQIAGSSRRGGIMDFVLGILGAILGGFVVGAFNIAAPGGGIALVLFNLVLATAMAVVLILIGRALRR